MKSPELDFIQVPGSSLGDLARAWGEKTAHHFHVDDGFMIGAYHGSQCIGLISSYWRDLPEPLAGTKELYIDFLEVRLNYRRKGIARELIERSIERAIKNQAYQVRSWSSVDKLEAIPMWKSLGFALCPATTFPRGKEVRGFLVSRVLGWAGWMESQQPNNVL
jgi:ribosomal protein S18 acetylase RimI-like enzyme